MELPLFNFVLPGGFLLVPRAWMQASMSLGCCFGSSRYLAKVRQRTLVSEHCSVEKAGPLGFRAVTTLALPSGEEETEGKLLR